MSEAMRKEFGQAISPLVFNIPALVTSTYAGRLDVEGFRFPDDPQGDDELWQVWQANGLDAAAALGHAEAIGLSRAALVVGDGDSPSDPPRITVESAFDCAWKRNPRTGRLAVGMKRWADEDAEGKKVEWCAIYREGITEWFVKAGSGWALDSSDEHGQPPAMVPLTNRFRLAIPDGQSEFESVLSIVDAINKVGTDMMQSEEYHAMPRRWAFGFTAADFRDPVTGALKTPWEALKNRIWSSSKKPSEVAVGQFPEADLRNFHETIRLLMQDAIKLVELPSWLATSESVNPPSADSLKAAERPFVKRVERKQVVFGDAWEDAMRLAMLRMGRSVDGADLLETVWRAADTPTIAQRADATMKLHAEGILPTEQARIDLGYTQVQRANMVQMDRAAMGAARDAIYGEASGGGREHR